MRQDHNIKDANTDHTEDEQENTRLSHQARAIELAQNGKLTSLDVGNFLDASTGGEGSTVLDIACGE